MPHDNNVPAPVKDAGLQLWATTEGLTEQAFKEIIFARSHFNPTAAVEFAEQFGPPNIVAMTGGAPKPVRSLSCEGALDLLQRNPAADFYFHPGTSFEGLIGKARKEHMIGSSTFWVDLDPVDISKGDDGKPNHDELARWLSSKLNDVRTCGLPQPQTIVFSGRGLWLFWRSEAMLLPDNIERVNAALASKLGGDRCHNIDRLARLPYTRNSKTGLYGAVLVNNAGYTDTSLLPRGVSLGPTNPPRKVDAIAAAATISAVEALHPYNLSQDALNVITHGKADRHNTRSEAIYFVSCEMMRRGVPDEIAQGILLNPELLISSGVLKYKSNAQKHAQRVVANAKIAVADFQSLPSGVIVKDSQHNVRVALFKLDIAVSYDAFNRRLLVQSGNDQRLLDDAEMNRLRLLIDERFRFKVPKDFFWDVVENTARQNSFHPVRDYFDGLTWDGQSRLDRWLTVYGGADDNPYTRAVAAKMLIAAVRRIRQPGCKFDEMPVFEGPQGTNKSSALAVLAVQESWFNDDLPLGEDTKRVIESLSGRLIVEAAELTGMRKSDVEHIKAFLSRRVDSARMAYARTIMEAPRQCIIVGTTNSAHYLRDGSGNRRFWPVKITCFDLAALADDRDQLWAEAAHREETGESIRLEPELWAYAQIEQQQRETTDPYYDELERQLGGKVGKIAASEIWDMLGLQIDRRTQPHAARLGEAMKRLGFERVKLRFRRGQQPEWGYVRGSPEERQEQLQLSRPGANGPEDDDGTGGLF